jgi:hypothetical protein
MGDERDGGEMYNGKREKGVAELFLICLSYREEGVAELFPSSSSSYQRTRG